MRRACRVLVCILEGAAGKAMDLMDKALGYRRDTEVQWRAGYARRWMSEG